MWILVPKYASYLHLPNLWVRIISDLLKKIFSSYLDFDWKIKISVLNIGQIHFIP